MYQANPLNIFGLRRIAWCPPHFEKLTFDLRADEKKITDWIYTHLTGRFYFDVNYVHSLKEGTHVGMTHCAAFEIPSEASYFALFLDDINKGKSY